jgi:hypothetical protein
MDAPNAFSSELEKWIYNRSIQSIFFVNIVAKDINQIEQRMNEVGTIEAEERGKELELDLDGQGRCCTGFVVEEKANHLTILTCAHLLHRPGSDPWPPWPMVKGPRHDGVPCIPLSSHTF